MKNIVICDDDVTLTHILAHILSKKDEYRVFTAGDGEDGWLRIRETRPVLLILDLDMPVKDGFAVLRKMDSMAPRRPYTIVLSGNESRLAQQKALAMGAHEVVTKPFKPAELLAKIEKLAADQFI